MMKVRMILNQIEAYKRFRDALSAIQILSSTELRNLKPVLEARFLDLGHVATMFNSLLRDVEDVPSLSIFAFAVDQTGCGIHNSVVFNMADYFLMEDFESKPYLNFTGYRARSFFTHYHSDHPFNFFYDTRKEMVGFFMTLCFYRFFFSTKVYLFLILFNRFYSAFKMKLSSFPQVQSDEYQKLLFTDHSYDLSLMAKDYGEDPTDHMVRFFSLPSSSTGYEYIFYLILTDAAEENEYSSVGGKINSLFTAIKNCDDLISDLFLVYNKYRQEAITTELLEVGLHTL